jgi:hypothetical protein
MSQFNRCSSLRADENTTRAKSMMHEYGFISHVLRGMVRLDFYWPY